jgi:hypothetical protein
MAQISNGILGGFEGKVGTVSGFTRYGRSYMRVAVSTVTDKATPARLAQREKLKVCNIFMKAFTGTGVFSKTFPNYGHGGSGYNRAMKVLMNKALYGTSPAHNIDYSKFLISDGPLPVAQNAEVTTNGAGNLQFTWVNNTGDGTAKASDKVILVAYFPVMNQIIFSLDAAQRSSGTALLTTSINKGLVAETWMGFLSADEKTAADSVYTGQLVV